VDLDILYLVALLGTQDVEHHALATPLKQTHADLGEHGPLALEELEVELEPAQLDHHVQHQNLKHVLHGSAH
jgi:hypothetical protein